MAVHWSCQNVVAEFKDIQANVMAVDCTGAHAVLAGRRMLALVNLDDPTKVIRKTSRGGTPSSKYDVKVVEWNPTGLLSNYIALAAGDECELHTVQESGSLKSLCSLHSDSRGISDLNWHHTDAHLLAMAGKENFVLLWDVREPRRPMSTLPAIAGTTQVKWNKCNSHLLASGHEHEMRIWDSRKPNLPVLIFPLALSKVNSLDWSPHAATHIVSASQQDNSIRFFDIATGRKRPIVTLHAKNPVLSAKYTPFGVGVVSSMAPQLVRNENSLLLWAAEDGTQPVHCFVGHTDGITSFGWRFPHNSSQAVDDCQLVSWGRDRCLRIWRLDSNLQKLCGGVDETAVEVEGAEAASPAAPAVPADAAPVADTTAETAPAPSPTDVQELDGNSSSNEPSSALPVVAIKEEAVELSPVADAGPSLAVSIKAEPSILQFLEPRLEPDAAVGSVDPTAGPTSVGDEVEGSVTPTLSSSVPPESSPYLMSTAGSSATLGRSPKKMTFKDELMALKATQWDHSQLGSIEVSGDYISRQVQLLVCSGCELVAVTLSVPLGYPASHKVHVTMQSRTTLSYDARAVITEALTAVAEQHARRGLNCLAAVTRELLKRLPPYLVEGAGYEGGRGAAGGSREEPPPLRPLYDASMYGSFQDHSVPFPRTSGARFCGNGLLICFTRPIFLSQKNQKQTAVHQTPRSLSALGAYIGNFKPYSSTSTPSNKPGRQHSGNNQHLRGVGFSSQAQRQQQLQLQQQPPHSSRQRQQSMQNLQLGAGGGGASSDPDGSGGHESRTAPTFNTFLGEDHNVEDEDPEAEEGCGSVSISKYYYHQKSKRKSRNKNSMKAGVLLIYSVESLLPLCRTLAQQYRLDCRDAVGSCLYNLGVALRHGRIDLVQVWTLMYRVIQLPPSTPASSSEISRGLDAPWALHPLARNNIDRLLSHLIKLGDIQTAAMLTCVYGSQDQQQQQPQHQPQCDLLQQQQQQQQHDHLQHGSRRSNHQATQQDNSRACTCAATPVSAMPAMPPSSTIVKGKSTSIPLPLSPNERAMIDEVSAASTGSDGARKVNISPRSRSNSSPSISPRKKPQPKSFFPRYSSMLAAKLADMSWFKSGGGSNYNTIHGVNVKDTSPDSGPMVRHNRSNSEGSLSESRSPHDPQGGGLSSDPSSSPSKLTVTRFLTSAKVQQCEEIRRAYCNILYNWQLLSQRAEVQQYCGQAGGVVLKDAEFLSECGRCKQLLRSQGCPSCRKPAVFCTICLLPVRGHSMFCLWCGHGGHTPHLMKWFSRNERCASGCGCDCINYYKQDSVPQPPAQRVQLHRPL